MPPLDEHRFRRKSDNALLLALRANTSEGHQSPADAPFRYSVHQVLDGVQVELREIPPAIIPGDRPVELEVPVLSAAALATLRAIRAGVHGLPIVYETDLYAARDALVVEVLAKAFPAGHYFSARVVVQMI